MEKMQIMGSLLFIILLLVIFLPFDTYFWLLLVVIGVFQGLWIWNRSK